MINTAFFVLLLAAIAAFFLREWENPFYRKAVQPVAEEGVLEEVRRVNPEQQKATCKLDGKFEFVCQGGDNPKSAVYLWGRPGAPHPRTAPQEECKTACEKFGPGVCVWRENGPELNGGTSCYFLSNAVCSPGVLQSVSPDTLPTSRVKNVASGLCELPRY